MSPSGSGPAAVPAAPSDPRELALHLEICRMQAELEGLESRIREVEAAKAAGGSGYDPFVERAEELVDRMVASLYLTGRSEIAASAVASDEHAEAVLADARRRAQEILNAARGELATVLSERADAMDASGAVPGGIVDLTDDAAIATSTPTAEAPPPPSAEEAPVARPLSAYPPPGAAAPVAPVEEVAPEAVAAPAEPSAPDSLPPLAEVIEPTGQVTPLEADEAPEAVAPVEEAPPSPVEETEVWPAQGAATPPVGTDAAFEAWLAVGPPRGEITGGLGADAAAEPDVDTSPDDRERPAWVRPVEGVLALVAVALVVIVALLIVG